MDGKKNWADEYYRIRGGIKDQQAYYRSLQKGYGTKHPEKISGFQGLMFGTGGDYVSKAVLEAMKNRSFKDFVYESLASFDKEEYGDVSAIDSEENGECRWLGNGNSVTGRYGYCVNPVRHRYVRFDKVLRIRSWKGNTWITMDCEPELFILYSKEELADVSGAAGRPDGEHAPWEGIEFLQEYRKHPEYYLPMTSRQYMTFKEKDGENSKNSYWSAGILAGCRPYFAECWNNTLYVITTAIWLSQERLVKQALPLLKQSGLIDVDLSSMRKEYPFVHSVTEQGGREFRIIRIYMDDKNPKNPIRWLGKRFSFEELNQLNKEIR